MANRVPLAVHEWYHCYNRGVDKRKVFSSKSDYVRFLISMHTSNSDKSMHIANQKRRTLEDVLSNESAQRGKPIVEIGAYALMPNHFHFVLKEIREGGIALFMQKVFTGYTMYFNKKYDRNGPLFAGVFKSKHVADDRYLKWLISYVHLNPADIFKPGWRDDHVHHQKTLELETVLTDYSYSSLPDFLGKRRPQRKILGEAVFELFDVLPTLPSMIDDAVKYDDHYIKVSP